MSKKTNAINTIIAAAYALENDRLIAMALSLRPAPVKYIKKGNVIVPSKFNRRNRTPFAPNKFTQ